MRTHSIVTYLEGEQGSERGRLFTSIFKHQERRVIVWNKGEYSCHGYCETHLNGNSLQLLKSSPIRLIAPF